MIGFLSNYYPAKFMEDGMIYSSVEQYILVKKNKLSLNDEALHQRIMLATGVSDLQKCEMEIVVDEWEWALAFGEIISRATALKFNQNPDLAKLLLS